MGTLVASALLPVRLAVWTVCGAVLMVFWPCSRALLCSTTVAGVASASVTSAAARRCRCGACASWTQ